MPGLEFYVIVYDIKDDRRRAKVAKLLEQIGDRVQYSVFEAWLARDELLSLLRRLEKRMDPSQDSIRVYALCSACQTKVRKMGVAVTPDPPGVRIV